MFKTGVAACLLALCATPVHAQARLPVVSSFSILGDLVSQVGGDKVEVTSLVGRNADAHVFQPTPKDVQTVAAARVLVVNGLGFDGWMARLSTIGRGASGPVTIVASASVDAQPRAAAPAESGHGDHDGHAGHDAHHNSHDDAHHGGIDPHAWQDPQRVQVYVRNIALGLAQADPGNAMYYAQRAAAYADKLKMLDAWIVQRLATVPPGKRKVITSHDAFGYFAQRYRVRMVAVAGVSTSAEAGAKDMADIVRLIKAEQVRALFFENISNPRLMQQISRETGATVGGKLYSDSLSEEGGPAADYLSLMRANVDTLVAGMLRN